MGGPGGVGGSPLQAQFAPNAFGLKVAVPEKSKVQLGVPGGPGGQVQWQVMEKSGSPIERTHSEQCCGLIESSH